MPCYPIRALGKFRCIHLARSASQCRIRNGRLTTRQQINVNTAFIDASQVYGSTDELAKNLRELKSEYTNAMNSFRKIQYLGKSTNSTPTNMKD